jgi:hypothetical protein
MTVRQEAEQTSTGAPIRIRFPRLGLRAGTLCLAILIVGCRSERGLPVAMTADQNTRALIWTDAGGLLSGEPSWVLRSDVLGPSAYLVVDTFDARSVCPQRVSFRVVAGGAIEYTVTLSSDEAGGVDWKVSHGDGDEVRISRCDPRPDAGRDACLNGGIPRPLLGNLDGEIEAEARDIDSPLYVRRVRFETSPTACP